MCEQTLFSVSDFLRVHSVFYVYYLDVRNLHAF